MKNLKTGVEQETEIDRLFRVMREAEEQREDDAFAKALGEWGAIAAIVLLLLFGVYAAFTWGMPG